MEGFSDNPDAIGIRYNKDNSRDVAKTTVIARTIEEAAAVFLPSLWENGEIAFIL